MEVRKLERNMETYLTSVLNVLAEASLAAKTPDDLAMCIKEGGAVFLSAAYARINESDLPFLDRSSINAKAGRVCSYLIQKATERFKYLRDPQPRFDGVGEPSLCYQESGPDVWHPTLNKAKRPVQTLPVLDSSARNAAAACCNLNAQPTITVLLVTF
jgi:hypothetical protein